MGEGVVCRSSLKALPDRVFVVDCETRGLRTRARLTEFAVVSWSAETIIDRWMVAIEAGDDPALREALHTLHSRAIGKILVMHNAGFDLRVLGREAARVGVACRLQRVLCTRRIAQRVLKGLSAFDLQTVASALGINQRVRHCALEDAELTARVYAALRSRVTLQTRR